jgi:acetolactate synthase I/II/III large subunit
MTVVFAKREYAVLKRESSDLGAGSPGYPTAHFEEIGRPNLDRTLLAKGMRVPGTRVSSAGCFGKKLRVELKGEGLTPIEGTVESLAARCR